MIRFKQKDIVLKSSLHDLLLISFAFSGLLLLVRLIVTGTFSYLFLPWNLFLAFIPYWISHYFGRLDSIVKNKGQLILFLGIWLLFIPNSFYIITDLFHLSRFNSAPQWFDLLMIFSFAWNGILCGIISTRRAEVLVIKLTKKDYSLYFVFVVMLLSAFGIYIGRFLRYNSWDILTDPFSLAGEIIDLVIHPFQNGYAWGMTICYAAFMSLIYLTVKKIGQTFL